MDIGTILIISAITLIYHFSFGKKHLEWFIFVLSILCLFYFQPVSPIRYFDFWVPSVSLLLGTIAWMLVSAENSFRSRKNMFGAILILFFVFILGLSRLFPQVNLQEFVSIPTFLETVIFIIAAIVLYWITNLNKNNRFLARILAITLIVIFILLKNQYLSLQVSRFLRGISNQTQSLANSYEFIWIGYSYFAFRLIHVLVDSQKKGRINVSLPSFIGYLFFFPALLAGPIMRIDDYQAQLNDHEVKTDEPLIHAFERLATGLFQKFILADMLALISMEAGLVRNITSHFWMWFVMIMYAFRIYFDFSGYTHIAIGIAKIIGITLPENFNRPLRSPNLAIFWNNWHITLTQWFRAYYFNPLTRFLRRRFQSRNPVLILAFMQISTMVLIGLWHGISWNFLLWGLWIGVGLFFQNQFSAWYMQNISNGKTFWESGKFNNLISTTATFMYVSLGWVWFAMPDLESSLYIFGKLFGYK